jgi:hypothetical protein
MSPPCCARTLAAGGRDRLQERHLNAGFRICSSRWLNGARLPRGARLFSPLSAHGLNRNNETEMTVWFGAKPTPAPGITSSGGPEQPNLPERTVSLLDSRLRNAWLLPGEHRREKLSDQPVRVDLVVMDARRKPKQLDFEVGAPLRIAGMRSPRTRSAHGTTANRFVPARPKGSRAAGVSAATFFREQGQPIARPGLCAGRDLYAAVPQRASSSSRATISAR